MSLWFVLRMNEKRIGSLEIQRQQDLDLTDKTAIADAVSDYKVFVATEKRPGQRLAGTVGHRYGDGAWVLLRKALELIPEAQEGGNNGL
jgi:hypothetical protein